jgi:chorismate synthase
MNIRVSAYVSSVHKIMVPVTYDKLNLDGIYSSAIRCPHEETAARMEAAIRQAKEEKDSLGGIITCISSGVPAGWGEPVFDKLHAQLGHAMLSINAVKAFEIGDGFSSTFRKGSENNDSLQTNHDGGIQGGISNGKDIVCKIAFKPTSTIGKKQIARDSNNQEVELEAAGRHDPCVLPRAVAIVEAMAAITLLDAALLSKTNKV